MMVDCWKVSVSAALVGWGVLVAPTIAADKADAPTPSVVPANAAEEKEAAVGPQPAPADEAGKTPVIACDEPDHNFGKMMAGPKLEHTFKIRNAGDAELKITKVKPACGCTTAGKHPEVLAPGEEGDFSFVIDSTKLHSGVATKTITVTSNDPKTPTLTLKLTADVTQPIDVQPSGAFFGNLYEDSVEKRAIKLTVNADKPVKLTLAEATTERKFNIELVEQEEGKLYELLVETKPPYAKGMHRETVVINSDLEAKKTIPITVTLNKPDRIDVSRDIIYIPKPPTAAPPNAAPGGQPQVVVVQNYGPTPFKVEEATIDDPEITVKVTESLANKRYHVTVMVPGTLELPPRGRTLVIKTNDEEKAEIKVPVLTAGTRLRPAELLVGEPAPTFDLSTLDGKQVSSKQFEDHKATVLNFVAPNCGFCKRQVPDVEKVRAEYEAKGVMFVNVVQKMRKEYTHDEMKEVFDATGSKITLAPDDNNRVGQLYKAQSYPTLFVIDHSGKVEDVTAGAKPDLDKTLSKTLDDLISKEEKKDASAKS